MSTLLDTRRLTKPSQFTGGESDWIGWDFAFRSYLALLSPRMDSLLDQALMLPEAPDHVDMDEETTQLSTQMFHLLVMLCNKGKPVTMLMSTERHNGFKAYHMLKNEYEPKIG